MRPPEETGLTLSSEGEVERQMRKIKAAAVLALVVLLIAAAAGCGS